MSVPTGESLYIYGLHDSGGEHLLMANGQARGWVLVTEEIGADPRDMRGGNYKNLAERGLGVIVRLNHAYGPNGTIPHSSRYPDFARRVTNFVRNSSGAHIWIIGNEMNLEREQPRQPGSNQAEPITPRRYATCYKLCRAAIRQLPGHERDQVLIGAIGPWNGQTPYEADSEGKYPANKIPGPGEYPYNGFFGDYILYLRDILLAIGRENCDGIALHAYSHGYEPALVFSGEKMGPPFQKYHYHFLTYRDQMNIIPPAFRDLPVYLTEVNGDREPGNRQIWPDVNRGWIKNVYKEINEWNKTGNQQIRCVILFRWIRDHEGWNIEGKQNILQDFREAIAMNYQWNPTAGITSAPTTTRPPYRTRYTNHTTPTTVSMNQTLTVNLTLQNIGGVTWVRDGANPFRLGFQWYTPAGQMLTFPAEFDFRTPLPADVPPDGAVSLQARLRTPATPGAYQLRWDMIHELVTWFTSQRDQGLLVTPINVTSTPVATTPAPGSTLPTFQIQDVSASLARSSSEQYPSRARSAIRRIILHHTATAPSVTVQRIADFHVKNRNLPGIAYHFCVTEGGVVFQTQPLEVVAGHAGNLSGDSVGLCLIGDFTQVSPSKPQLDAAAVLLAYLATELRLGVDQIFGYSELVKTGSPGATWPTWKNPLMAQVRSLMPRIEPSTPTSTPTPVVGKALEHYLLLWYKGPGNWAKWDLLGALEYIEKFPVTVGFSIEEAKSAKYVTIVGGPAGVSGEAEQILRAAGCQVERLAGSNETETRQMLEQLAAAGRRFKTLGK